MTEADRENLKPFGGLVDAVASSTNGESYRYEVDEDGTIWLMNGDSASRMWPDAETFLLDGDCTQSIFSFVGETLSFLDRNFGGMAEYDELLPDPVDVFCVKNRWMAAYAGCRSKEELEVKMAAMGAPVR